MTEQSTNKRAIVLVLDSVGIGAMPDAAEYNDPDNCNTLGNVARECGGLHLPHLQAMGLGALTEVAGVPAATSPTAAFGRMAELAPGKDTTTGHWEMAGAILDKPLALFPDGYPQEFLDEFAARTGRGTLCNQSISGTVAIDEYAEEQRESGKWIVYTSADSVFQIAAHEGWIPLEELYAACKIAREMLEPWFVGRVIARPFVGETGSYERTANRKDYAFDPPSTTVLERLSSSGIKVTGVGKIGNIFNEQGVDESFKTKNNEHGMDVTMKLVEEGRDGFLFVNLVDFDSKFGHRNNPGGYGQALEEFDVRLGELLPLLNDDDLLILTADHGCDPTVPGTNHSREYVPLLVRHSSLAAGTDLGTRTTFADIAQSLTAFWGLSPMSQGTSFLPTESAQ